MYWVEEAYLWETGGFDDTIVGRVTSNDQLDKDGENWYGSCDGYKFNCFKTLEDALNGIVIRPSSLLYHESLTKEDTQAIKQFVRENEPQWIAKNHATDAKEIVTPIYDKDKSASYYIALFNEQNEEVHSNLNKDGKPIVRADFNKEQKTMALFKLSKDGSFEEIEESSSYYEDLVYFACNSVYKYCHLYEEVDMANFYTKTIRNAYLNRVNEEMER